MTQLQPARAVAAIIKNGDDILLVKQQGPIDPEPFYALPGGKVEHGEAIVDALLREIWEETGLVANLPDRLLFISETTWAQGGTTLGFCFMISGWQGKAQVQDPDGIVLDVEWVPLKDAIAHLEKIPLRNIAEPVCKWLSGDQQECVMWCYREDSLRIIQLETQINMARLSN
jgi:ADP-ribose pyrophosphatase YjhB (NUDIX family)